MVLITYRQVCAGAFTDFLKMCRAYAENHLYRRHDAQPGAQPGNRRTLQNRNADGGRFAERFKVSYHTIRSILMRAAAADGNPRLAESAHARSVVHPVGPGRIPTGQGGLFGSRRTPNPRPPRVNHLRNTKNMAL